MKSIEDYAKEKLEEQIVNDIKGMSQKDRRAYLRGITNYIFEIMSDKYEPRNDEKQY